MLEAVRTDPFIPIYWGANQPGMQATAELPHNDAILCEEDWLEMRDLVAERVERQMARGLHKQIANRALEPWMWATTIITATDWGNFFGLRCHPAAQPEFQKLARMMKEAMDASQPELLGTGQWHLPYTPDIEVLRAKLGFSPESIAKVSCARCARVSYTNQGVVKSVEDDLALAGGLGDAGHMSPFEHAAVANPVAGYVGNFNGWIQLRKFMKNEDDFSKRGGA
jgi:hypothetical protein